MEWSTRLGRVGFLCFGQEGGQGFEQQYGGVVYFFGLDNKKYQHIMVRHNLLLVGNSKSYLILFLLSISGK